MSQQTRTASLIARDAAAVWHPFTQHSLWVQDNPIVVDRAAGMHFWDTEGNKYLDGVSSLWVNVHGHCHPRIADAIASQVHKLDHTTFLGLTHEPGIELAERLVEISPAGLDKVFYAGDGSSAVEAALKMAYQAQAQTDKVRPLIVHLEHAYHGDTLGAVSVGGMSLFHSTYADIMLKTRQIGSPGDLEPGQSRSGRAQVVAAELSALLAEVGEEVCAIIVEPLVQGAAGMLTYDPEFLRAVRRECDQYGIYLIADEVATGIGRTGTMFAVDQAGVRPDLLTLGKGITGGFLPLSAVLATDEIYSAFLGSPIEAKTFFHGHSYTANPLAAVAANATLDLFAEDDTLSNVAAVSDRLKANLTSVAEHPGVVEVRQLGAMVGIEVSAKTDRAGFDVCQAAREHGVWIRPLGDTVILMPPLAIDLDQVDQLTAAVSAGLDQVYR